jgi:hypothetical protein
MNEQQPQKNKVDFNEVMNADNLKQIPVGKCLPSPDGKILACRVSENEWDIKSDLPERLKGNVKIKL